MNAKNKAIQAAALSFLTTHLEGQFKLTSRCDTASIETWGEAHFTMKGRNIDLVAKILRRTLGLDMYRGIIDVTVIDFAHGNRNIVGLIL